MLHIQHECIAATPVLGEARVARQQVGRQSAPGLRRRCARLTPPRPSIGDPPAHSWLTSGRNSGRPPPFSGGAPQSARCDPSSASSRCHSGRTSAHHRIDGALHRCTRSPLAASCPGSATRRGSGSRPATHTTTTSCDRRLMGCRRSPTETTIQAPVTTAETDVGGQPDTWPWPQPPARRVVRSEPL